jgi:diguanylate cyclase (GGDEF)-like protein
MNLKNKKLIFKNKKLNNSNEALIIVVKYGVFGVLWIMLSDNIIEIFLDNLDAYKNLQTYKGWAFVFLTMILFYYLINNRDNRILNFSKNEIKTNEELNLYEEKLKHMAFYDSLTNLPNRAMFINEAKNLIDNNLGKSKFAMAYLDIDNFKYINDTLGHHVGNEFLIHISNALLDEVNDSDVVARLGGDEFAILLNNVDSEESLMQNLNKIKENISVTWDSHDHQFFITISIGAAIFPDQGSDITTLLKNSDIAMYVAKNEGKNKVMLYKESFEENTRNHINMVNKLQKGLENNEFTINCQNQYEISTGKIVGMEILVRWVHPLEGIIYPEEFIYLAEETGQIYILEQQIINLALAQKMKLEEEGFNNIKLSINISSKTLISDLQFSNLEKIFSSFDVDYSNIVIEITETAVLSNLELAVERLNILKSKGVKIALDDFGTGYSSITYLKNLPIDIIKLDRSYINSIPNDAVNTAIVKNVLNLAKDLNFIVIAEGIETNEQLNYLRNIICQIGQGYYFGMPLSTEDSLSIIRMI